jgi:hypothetical protein
MLPDVTDLTDVLASLKADGHDFTREKVARLSPYMITHLKRPGQYVLGTGSQPPPLKPIFRTRKVAAMRKSTSQPEAS